MKLQRKHYEIADILKSHYDYLDKMSAIKFIKDLYGKNNVEIKDICLAYNLLHW